MQPLQELTDKCVTNSMFKAFDLVWLCTHHSRIQLINIKWDNISVENFKDVTVYLLKLLTVDDGHDSHKGIKCDCYQLVYTSMHVEKS